MLTYLERGKVAALVSFVRDDLNLPHMNFLQLIHHENVMVPVLGHVRVRFHLKNLLAAGNSLQAVAPSKSVVDPLSARGDADPGGEVAASVVVEHANYFVSHEEVPHHLTFKGTNVLARLSDNSFLRIWVLSQRDLEIYGAELYLAVFFPTAEYFVA